eukprot:gene8744-8924_t
MDPNVKSVYVAVSLAAVPSYLNTTDGKGVLICVLDSGVQYTTAQYGNCTAINRPVGSCRVVTGYDFVGDEYTAANDSPRPKPDKFPVASTAASSFGVAPGALLGAYRVFGCDSDTTDDIIIAAIDRAVRDGCDVINLSLAGSSGYPDNGLYGRVMGNAAARGVLTTRAVGNLGDDGAFAADSFTAAGAVLVAAAGSCQSKLDAQVASASFSSYGPVRLIRVDALLSNQLSAEPTFLPLPSALTSSYTATLTFIWQGRAHPSGNVAYNAMHRPAAAISIADSWYLDLSMQRVYTSMQVSMNPSKVVVNTRTKKPVALKVTFTVPAGLAGRGLLYSGLIRLMPAQARLKLTPVSVPYQGYSKPWSSLPLLARNLDTQDLYHSEQLQERTNALCYTPKSQPAITGAVFDVESGIPFACDAFTARDSDVISVSARVLRNAPACALRITLAPQVPIRRLSVDVLDAGSGGKLGWLQPIETSASDTCLTSPYVVGSYCLGFNGSYTSLSGLQQQVQVGSTYRLQAGVTGPVPVADKALGTQADTSTTAFVMWLIKVSKGLVAVFAVYDLLQAAPGELQALAKVLDDRDNAIRNGMTIDGERYEDHLPHAQVAASVFSAVGRAAQQQSEAVPLQLALAITCTNQVTATLQEFDPIGGFPASAGADDLLQLACRLTEDDLMGSVGKFRAALQAQLDQRDIARVQQLYVFAATATPAASPAERATLRMALLMPGTGLLATPLYVKRLCNVPLAQALLTPGQMMAGQTGYLSMDQARSLVPLEATDANVYTTPLVGLWVKGPGSVMHPLVAAACQRFAYSSLLMDRAVSGDGAFLLLLCPEGDPVSKCFEISSDDPSCMQLAFYTLQASIIPAAGMSQYPGGLVKADWRPVLLSQLPPLPGPQLVAQQGGSNHCTTGTAGATETTAATWGPEVLPGSSSAAVDVMSLPDLAKAAASPELLASSVQSSGRRLARAAGRSSAPSSIFGAEQAQEWQHNNSSAARRSFPGMAATAGATGDTWRLSALGIKVAPHLSATCEHHSPAGRHLPPTNSHQQPQQWVRLGEQLLSKTNSTQGQEQQTAVNADVTVAAAGHSSISTAANAGSPSRLHRPHTDRRDAAGFPQVAAAAAGKDGGGVRGVSNPAAAGLQQQHGIAGHHGVGNNQAQAATSAGMPPGSSHAAVDIATQGLVAAQAEADTAQVEVPARQAGSSHWPTSRGPEPVSPSVKAGVDLSNLQLLQHLSTGQLQHALNDVGSQTSEQVLQQTCSLHAGGGAATSIPAADSTASQPSTRQLVPPAVQDRGGGLRYMQALQGSAVLVFTLSGRAAAQADLLSEVERLRQEGPPLAALHPAVNQISYRRYCIIIISSSSRRRPCRMKYPVPALLQAALLSCPLPPSSPPSPPQGVLRSSLHGPPLVEVVRSRVPLELDGSDSDDSDREFEERLMLKYGLKHR